MALTNEPTTPTVTLDSVQVLTQFIFVMIIAIINYTQIIARRFSMPKTLAEGHKVDIRQNPSIWFLA